MATTALPLDGEGDTPAVSIVVVSWNMARELPRTLLSLAPPYQRPVAGGSELILVDNGSDPAPRRADFPGVPGLAVHQSPVRSPSPVAAINFGIAAARGGIVGVWIDGARLASPGLVRAATEVLRQRPRAVVATPNYHLGHAPQYHPSARSYDAAAEDRLLASIGWPEDGRRLFEIARPAAMSGVDGPMLETNALFMTREMWAEVGGYDPVFASPGGGAANPDVFRRALERPGAELVKIAGEATFHQIHGGVTSNRADAADTLKRLAVEYARVRGRPLAPYRGAASVYDPATGVIAAETASRAAS